MLSILIPTYKFFDGICSILDNLNKSNNDLFEVIIFDDSPDYEIYFKLKDKKYLFNFHIYKGDQKGAVHNWNKLLSMKTREYYMLLHQDEIPCPNFINKLDKLLNSLKPTILSINTLILKDEDKFHLHSSAFMRKFFFNLNPYALFSINFIGPVSSLIFNKKIKIKFDHKLQWLVDVDAYVKLKDFKWSFDDTIYVTSIPNIFSITNQTNVKKLNKYEKKYIFQNKLEPFMTKKYLIIFIWYFFKIFKILK